jgi:hypothetical protein
MTNGDDMLFLMLLVMDLLSDIRFYSASPVARPVVALVQQLLVFVG